MNIREGDVQLGGQIARDSHHGQEGGGGHHLQEELLLLGESLVVAAEELEVVIHKSDGGIGQGVQADQRYGDQSLPLLRSEGNGKQGQAQHGGQERGHKSDTAHGRRTRLGLVGVNVLVDGLSRLLGAEDGQSDAPEEQGQQKGNAERYGGIYGACDQNHSGKRHTAIPFFFIKCKRFVSCPSRPRRWSPEPWSGWP